MRVVREAVAAKATSVSTPDRCRRSAISQTPKAVRNCMRIAVGASETRAVMRGSSMPSAQPAMSEAGTLSTSSGIVVAVMAKVAAITAPRKITSALASLNRLSPSRMETRRRGGLMWRRTAEAATASGGATMAPSAIAGAQARSGVSQRATMATAMVVATTAPSTRPETAIQSRFKSRIDMSKPASTSTGARKSASARSGSSSTRGAPGTKATPAPTSARKAG